MRKLTLTTVLSAIISAVLFFNQSAIAAKDTGPLAEYKGKWVIVSYWADWCHYCLEELPQLNSFYNKNRDRVVVLGVNYDGLPKARLDAFSKQKGLSFPMLSSFPIYKYSDVAIDHIPMTFVFDPNGKLTKVLDGAQNKTALANVTGLS